MKLCPCGTEVRYMECCGLYLLKKATPETPEVLMRSRFTAYVENNFQYIKKTMQGKALTQYGNKKSIDRVGYYKLEIYDTYLDPSNPDIGFVSFRAYYWYQGQKEVLSERSVFHRIEGRWFYVDAEFSTEVLAE